MHMQVLVCVSVPCVTWGGSHTFIETLYEQKKEHRTCVMIRTSDVSEGKLKHVLQKTPTKLRAEMETKQRFVKKKKSFSMMTQSLICVTLMN